MTTIKTILYPTDFSEHSLAALPLAVDLANHYRAQLHCLHVVDSPYEGSLQNEYIVPMAIEPRISSEEQKRLARERLDRFVLEHMPELRGTARKAVFSGNPFEEIIRYTRQQSIDLIVIGTHGHSALASMLLGSVAEKVIRKAPCVVLSVRHPKHKFKAP